jgi:galactokinase
MNAEWVSAQPAVDPVSLSARFRDMFGTLPNLFRAPGRVNLIGEHTDYNEGFVMPVALDLSCWIAAARRADRTIVVHSINADQTASIDVDAVPGRTGAWVDYVAGVAAMLRSYGAGRGANLLVHSEVPPGAGLSSSAALEVSVATALLGLEGVSLDPTTVARLCQRAENEVVGAAVGIMDQYTAVHARAGAALMLDCRALQHRQIPLPPDVRIVACNSMIRHSIAGGEYNTRRAECAAAVLKLKERNPAVTSLRDVDLPCLEAARETLGDRLFRRARHVVTENARVIVAADALDRHDLSSLGPLLAASHRSLRDDYEVSIFELDLLVDAAVESPGVHGSRMTGGGFGGCTINLVDESAVEEFRSRITNRYESATGLKPDIFVSRSADAAGAVDA